MEQENTNKSFLPKLAVAGALVAVVIGGVAMSRNGKSTKSAGSGNFKDGTYSAVGSYISPAGAEQIGVNLTVKGNVVTTVAVQPMATRPMSLRFQTAVKDNVSQYVVGKKLSEIQLDKVAGSSLTPKGFNDALIKIKSQAKA